MNSFEQIYNQSIGFLLCSTRYSFVLLKGLEQKMPAVNQRPQSARVKPDWAIIPFRVLGLKTLLP